MMYLRFAGFSRDERSHCSLGMFQIAYRLYEAELEPYLYEEIRYCLDWFNDNLQAPSRVHRPGRCRYAICWFQPTAHKEIAMARRLVAAIEQTGIPMRTLRTARPGYIVHRDPQQVVAIPLFALLTMQSETQRSKRR